MTKVLYFTFLSLFFGYAHASELDTCRQKLANDISALLTTSNINLESATLASDVTNILQPKFEDIVQNSAECKNIHDQLLANGASTFSVHFSDHQFDIDIKFTSSLNDTIDEPIPLPEELERLLPWYGILVVKKGSLDRYANSDTPIISSEYMRSHMNEFFPSNSDKTMGLTNGCTHGNHMAHDKDVVNRAAHLTMNENDSYWSGNDYYVYDGEDVYWGWATIAGEVALALATFGISAEAAAASASIKTAGTAVTAASKSVKAVDLVADTTKIKNAATVAKAAKAGTSATAVASRADAVKALTNAGITVKKGTRAADLIKIGNTLDKASDSIKTFSWTSTLTTAATKPWRLVKNGITTLKPQNLSKLLGKGATWGQRFKVVAPTVAVTSVSLWSELRKAWGYSSAALEIDDNIKMNGFGLLSADNLEERENEVSHGAWLQFDEVGQSNPNDALHEALAFAEAFQSDMTKINTETPLCDVDIYVVQPAISNPKKLGTREIYYIIQNPGGSLSVSSR